MTRLRVAVVGVGHLGQHHARILASLPDVELVGVSDSRADQLAKVAAANKTQGYADYRDLVGRVDAVSIAVPTVFHRQVAGAFLERGIHAMVEKPLATSLAEAEEIVALADKHGALLQVGHIERYNPAFTAFDGLLRPKYITSERLSTHTFRSTDIGAVLDIMIHDLDLVLAMIAAPVRSVSAVGVSVFGGHEDVANARVEFEDGCVADLTASRVSFQTVRKMRLWGAEGYASLDFTAQEGTLVQPSEQLRRGEVDLEGVDLTKTVAIKERLFGTILRVDKVKPTSPDGRDQLTLELDDFVQSVRAGTRPTVSGTDALKTMRLADQILRSVHAHQWEGMPTGPTGPHLASSPGYHPGHILHDGPISWRIPNSRQSSPTRADR